MLDEEEIQEWTADLKPEDFGAPKRDSDKRDEDDKTDGEDK